MATYLDVAGVDYPREFQGRKPLPLEGKSLLPIFRGEKREEHEQLCWSVPRHHAIRTGKWKAVKPRKGGRWQLFDLDADGTETLDLADREPEVLKRMSSRFETWLGHVGAE